MARHAVIHLGPVRHGTEDGHAIFTLDQCKRGCQWDRRDNRFGIDNGNRCFDRNVEGDNSRYRCIDRRISQHCLRFQLARQRRIRPEIAARLQNGQRDVRTRFGVDEETCTGDRACIRLSGCPSLTIKANPDPLRDDPVTTILDSCVGCGLCGEVTHAAVLCPSFYKVDIVRNPNIWDRFKDGLHRRLLGDTAKAGA